MNKIEALEWEVVLWARMANKGYVSRRTGISSLIKQGKLPSDAINWFCRSPLCHLFKVSAPMECADCPWPDAPIPTVRCYSVNSPLSSWQRVKTPGDRKIAARAVAELMRQLLAEARRETS